MVMRMMKAKFHLLPMGGKKEEKYKSYFNS